MEQRKGLVNHNPLQILHLYPATTVHRHRIYQFCCQQTQAYLCAHRHGHRPQTNNLTWFLTQRGCVGFSVCINMCVLVYQRMRLPLTRLPAFTVSVKENGIRKFCICCLSLLNNNFLYNVLCCVECVCGWSLVCRYVYTGALCGQALSTAPEQGKLSLTSASESVKDGLCCLCGRTERSQALSVAP